MRVEEVRKLEPLRRLVYWIREREEIRLKKEAGDPSPWTDDEILSTYRFCNVRRMDDKVSRWLLDNWYVPYRNHSNLLGAVALARFINLPSSLQAVTSLLFRDGPILWDTVKETFRSLKSSGRTIFNGAYMVRGNDGQDKISSVVDFYIGSIEKAKIEVDSDSMEETWSRLLACYGMGSFMAGQIVADLRWAVEGEWADRVTWAPLGPGSARGMSRVHGRPVKSPLNQNTFLVEIRELRSTVAKYLPIALRNRIELMDLQNCLCEYDKYNRVLLGEGKPKQLYRQQVDL